MWEQSVNARTTNLPKGCDRAKVPKKLAEWLDEQWTILQTEPDRSKYTLEQLHETARLAGLQVASKS